MGAVDLRQPISDTLKLLRGQLEQSRTLVHFLAEDEPFPVSIDEAQLKQLFLNLFQNALEAMGPDGELTVRVARNQTPGTSAIVVEISDTGPGMPDSVKAHIFEPFFTTKPTGSGLGLAICRSIVDAHRGSIRAEDNNPQPGTTIVVELHPAGGSTDALQPVAALKDLPQDPQRDPTAK
jgi:signal transduction histidine kinase